MKAIIAVLTLFSSLLLQAQNVGVNANTPSQPLEVGGIIFTNQGGVMFPDSTIQTTAAATGGATDATDMPRSFGVMTIDGVMGPYTEMPYQDAFQLYDLVANAFTTVSIGGGSGGGGIGTSSPEFGDFVVITDVGKGIVPIYERVLTNDAPYPDVVIELLLENGEPYFRYTLQTALFKEVKTQMVYRGGGEYAHLAFITMSAVKFAWEDLDSGECFCWDLQMNNDCGCP